MGTFTVRFKVSSIQKSESPVEIEGLVDTGAAYPFVPASTLRSLGIAPTTEKEFVLADGSKSRYPVGEARFSFNGESAPCRVVFAPEGTEPLLGALILESLGLDVDRIGRRPKPTTLYLA